MNRAVVEVAAGLVVDGGRLLIARRPDGRHLAGFWEFPGGKRHADESLAACLRRELQEELGIEVEVGREIESLRHDYPEKSVWLRFLQCRLLKGEPRALDCAEWAWIGVGDLDRYAFPPADARLLDRLRSEPALWHWANPSAEAGAKRPEMP